MQNAKGIAFKLSVNLSAHDLNVGICNPVTGIIRTIRIASTIDVEMLFGTFDVFEIGDSTCSWFLKSDFLWFLLLFSSFTIAHGLLVTGQSIISRRLNFF